MSKPAQYLRVTSRGRIVAAFSEYTDAMQALPMLARLLQDPMQMLVKTSAQATLPFPIPKGVEAVPINEEWTTFCAKP